MSLVEGARLALDLLLAGAVLALAVAALFARERLVQVVFYLVFGLVLALVWAVLGAPDVALAVPGFAAFFLSRSAAAGLDVARRALARLVDVRPGELRVPLRLPPGWPRVVLADTATLLPGTLVVEVQDDALLMHAMDTTTSVAEDLARIEEQVARLFGLSVPSGPTG